MHALLEGYVVLQVSFQCLAEYSITSGDDGVQCILPLIHSEGLHVCGARQFPTFQAGLR